MGGALGSLHVVLGASRAGFGVFLVEGDAFGFAHKRELDVDAVEKFEWEKAGSAEPTAPAESSVL